LSQHQELSGRKIQYFDPETKENYVPYVVETSIGCDRMFLATMSNALVEEQVPGSDNMRPVLKLNPAIAPVKCAVLPLKKNEPGIVELAKKLHKDLSFSFNTHYDDTGSIGKLYRRQDAVGTPFCVTIDFDSMEDQTVTIRDRDTLTQERVPMEKVEAIVKEKVDMRKLFS